MPIFVLMEVYLLVRYTLLAIISTRTLYIVRAIRRVQYVVRVLIIGNSVYESLANKPIIIKAMTAEVSNKS